MFDFKGAYFGSVNVCAATSACAGVTVQIIVVKVLTLSDT